LKVNKSFNATAFSGALTRRYAADEIMKYQLVLQFPLSEDFDFDELIELETKITFELGNDHDVDGHDLGSGEINIYVHTDAPEMAFEKIMVALGAQLTSTLKAAYRDMGSDQYTWLHPSNHQGTFHIA